MGYYLFRRPNGKQPERNWVSLKTHELPLLSPIQNLTFLCSGKHWHNQWHIMLEYLVFRTLTNEVIIHGHSIDTMIQ